MGAGAKDPRSCSRAAPAERVAFLDEACAGDPAIRAEVASLLEAHDSTTEFLEAPAAQSGGSFGDGAPDKLARRAGSRTVHHPSGDRSRRNGSRLSCGRYPSIEARSPQGHWGWTSGRVGTSP